ncbi:MAG TPA: 6-phosphogluconolactonase [Acidimicrobiales bacterium]|nr:6-phosphogluconolactonase [Acidimicrobiales bacterium]
MNGRIDRVTSVPDAFARTVVEALAGSRQERFSLFLSGGSTAQECYQRLAESGGPDSDVRWDAVDIYLGDERCVPPDDPDSNHRMIRQTLLDQVGPVGSDHPMYRNGSPSAAATDYQAVIGSLPAFDLVHLGLGPDGHTASLFPESAALDIVDPEVLVAANQDPRANNPHDRVTLTLAGIARARLVVFTVAGSSKREALAAIAAGTDLPAGRVVADEVLWLVDDDAGGDGLPR